MSFSFSFTLVQFSTKDKFKLYALLENGDLVANSLQDNFLSQITPTRFPPEKTEEREVEFSVYKRNFSQAIDKAISLAEKYSQRQRYTYLFILNQYLC